MPSTPVDNPASRTALMVAAYRARAATRYPFCHDPWATWLAGPDGHAVAEEMDRHLPHMELWIALRTAWLDALVRYVLEQRGVEQVVVLGAGLDSRAARLGGEGVRFFEVDTPTSQALKLARLEAVEGYPREATTFVTCNFEHQDFLVRLAEAGFDAGRPALFLIEGVVYYLTEAAVRATLGAIATRCHPETAVSFDFLGKRLVERNRVSTGNDQAVELVTRLGEPFRFGVNDILPLLYEVGFRSVRTTSFDEICLSYEGSYLRDREFRFQHMAVASSGDILPL